MKNLRLIFAGLPLLLLAGCWGYGSSDDVVLTNEPPAQYEAVIMDRDSFEDAVKVQPQQTMVKAGKIYIKDQLLFINDVNRGFHIYNYSDPMHPVYRGFLNAPGATDLAMRDDVIYLNQATDLVTMIFEPVGTFVTVTKRNRDVFPPIVSPNGNLLNVADNEVVIGWQEL